LFNFIYFNFCSISETEGVNTDPRQTSLLLLSFLFCFCFLVVNHPDGGSANVALPQRKSLNVIIFISIIIRKKKKKEETHNPPYLAKRFTHRCTHSLPEQTMFELL